MDPTILVAGLIVGLALLFSFTNGFHDSATQVATIISSRTLSPEAALVLAAASDFTGAYFLGTSVARTIGRGIVDPQVIPSSGIGAAILISALVAAVSWNLVTWYLGLPSSSSHALIGGLIGAFLAGLGAARIQWNQLRNIILVMLVSPLVGFFLTYVLTKLTYFCLQWATPKAQHFFKGLQIITLIAQSLFHGTNDAQKTMGMIVLALIVTGFQTGGTFVVPQWVILSSAITMAFGIVVGGWKIIRTLGSGLYRVRSIHSFTSQTMSALVMSAVSFGGFPVSTTQVISSSVLGAGAAFRPKSVRWALAFDMLVAWLVTIPASALIAAGIFKTLKFFL